MKTKFDKEIVAFRTLLCAVAAPRVAKLLGMEIDDTTSAMIGGAVGAAYDLVIYRVKVWFSERKA